MAIRTPGVFNQNFMDLYGDECTNSSGLYAEGLFNVHLLKREWLLYVLYVQYVLCVPYVPYLSYAHKS